MKKVFTIRYIDDKDCARRLEESGQKIIFAPQLLDRFVHIRDNWGLGYKAPVHTRETSHFDAHYFNGKGAYSIASRRFTEEGLPLVSISFKTFTKRKLEELARNYKLPYQEDKVIETPDSS